MTLSKSLGVAVTSLVLCTALFSIARAAVDGGVEEPAQAAPARTLRGVLVEDGRFTSFLAALQAAGLARLLDGEESWTIFAPTDEAWATLDDSARAQLSVEENRGELIRLVSHHVVQGANTLEDLGRIVRFPSLHGTNLALRRVSDDVYAVDAARLVEIDVSATNGIVHVLDAPLIPPGLTIVSPRSLYGGGLHAYAIDPVHSAVLFRVMHMEIGACWGWFREFEGTLTVDTDDPSTASLSMKVNVASIDTGHAYRDGILREKGFFHTDEYPDMVYESREVEVLGDGRMVLRGDLTWREITKPVDCTVRKLGEGTFGPREYRVGYEGEFSIRRSDFGVAFGIPDVAGDEVRVTVALESVRDLERGR